MSICGFTIARNVIKYDYPIKEAILSVLPVCDKFVVAVGASEDDTLDYIKGIESDKIEIVHSVWDDSLREGGQVLAVETNKAKAAIDPSYDWCFYIQGDEVLHERGYDEILAKTSKYADDPKVEGFLFQYHHFYGSYDYIAMSKRWYKHEIRIVRNDPTIGSYKDAQGFRKKDEKLNVVPLDAYIHHYGWVKHPKTQQAKQREFKKLWMPDEAVSEQVTQEEEFDYSNIDIIARFDDVHPKVIQERISLINWKFEPPANPKVKTKIKMQEMLKRNLNIEIGTYRNYRIIKGY